MADPDPMTCDPGSRVYDPDPGTVIPDPIYLVTTLKPLTKCSLWLMFILVNNTRQSGVFSVDNFITVNPSNCRFSFP